MLHFSILRLTRKHWTKLESLPGTNTRAYEYALIAAENVIRYRAEQNTMV
jgi:hypothetical protein